VLRALDIPREAADAGDLRLVTGLFADADVEPEIARKLRLTVVITFECYEQDDVPIFTDERVRSYLRLAHDSVPHLLYYLAADPAAGALLGFGAAYGALTELPDSGLLAVDLGGDLLSRLGFHLAAAARHAQQQEDEWEPVVAAHLAAFDEPLRARLHAEIDALVRARGEAPWN
jgi:hypothetical protein